MTCASPFQAASARPGPERAGHRRTRPGAALLCAAITLGAAAGSTAPALADTLPPAPARAAAAPSGGAPAPGLVATTAAAPATTTPPATITPATDRAGGADTAPGAGAATGSAPVAQLLRDADALRAILVKKSALVAAADARVAQAQADVAASKLLPNPSLDLSVGGIILGTTNPAGLTYAQTAVFDVGVSETIEIGKRGPRAEAAEHRLSSARASAQASTLDAVADAREALGRVAYLAARSALLDEGLAAARQGAAVEEAKLLHGGTSGIDTDRLALEVAALEAEAARGKADLASALAACRSALRTPCDATGAGEDDLDAAAPVPASKADGADKVEDRPDILAVRKEADASRADAALARARAIPDPTIRAGYTRDQLTIAGDQLNTLTFSVSLPLPIFDHGQHDAAKAEARATELSKTATAMTAAAQGDAAGLRARRAQLEKTLEAMKKDALPRARRVVSVTEKAFADGQVGLTDLLLARRAYLGLRLSGIDLAYEHFTVRSSLRRALGLDGAAR